MVLPGDAAAAGSIGVINNRKARITDVEIFNFFLLRAKRSRNIKLPPLKQ
jgi:hypothetical protein